MDIKQAKLFINQNNHHILTGLSVIGIGITVYNAIIDTRKAEDHFWEEQDKTDKKLSYWKIVWPDYIPTFISALLTASCGVASDLCADSKIEGFSSAYLLSQATLQEYQRKVVERIGKNKERELMKDLSLILHLYLIYKDNHLFLNKKIKIY